MEAGEGDTGEIFKEDKSARGVMELVGKNLSGSSDDGKFNYIVMKNACIILHGVLIYGYEECF